MRASGDPRLAAARSSVIPRGRGRRGPESRRAGPRVAPDADGSGGPSDARPVQQPSRIGGTTLAWLAWDWVAARADGQVQGAAAEWVKE